VMAPPKTPPNLVNWLSEEFANALRQPQIVQMLNELACEPVGSTPEATGAFIRNESERWKSVIRDAKMGI
jgi:tripartite-type tricarboxylate transporter receptor subunit TctC